ncbi:MAG TPA: metallophosphoesterase [Blastocatellia bacterium]|nr:metallophosphoesterase [Blastocatellia bacterium]
MHEITGDQEAVKTLLRHTIQYLEQNKAQTKKATTKAMSASKKGAKKDASMDDVVNLWQDGLDRIEGKKAGKKSIKAAGLKRLQTSGEAAVDRPYAPRDQLIAVFQSAMDEYLDKIVGPTEQGGEQKASKKSSPSAKSATKSASMKKKKAAATLNDFFKSDKTGTRIGTKTKSADILAQFGPLDPRWVKVAVEKAKILLKGKHDFVRHKSPTDFRFVMGNETTVAIVGDWGGGNAAAQAVAQQIKKLQPNHVIHLGDVYYSGTPKETQERFLKFWPTPKSPGHSFALNSNHEMYSGGYGYFDYTLKQFKQPASYFSLANDNWRFIGLDTGYDEHQLHEPQVEWLKGQFTGGGPKTIFLSHHQLFSAYEKTKTDALRKSVQPFLDQVYGWIWGHEHLAVVYEKREGIKAVCLGNGCFPYNLPKNAPTVPVKWLDRHASSDPDYRGGHTFALFKIKGPQIIIEFIDHNGSIGFTETWL